MAQKLALLQALSLQFQQLSGNQICRAICWPWHNLWSKLFKDHTGFFYFKLKAHLVCDIAIFRENLD